MGRGRVARKQPASCIIEQKTNKIYNGQFLFGTIYSKVKLKGLHNS